MSHCDECGMEALLNGLRFFSPSDASSVARLIIKKGLKQIVNKNTENWGVDDFFLVVDCYYCIKVLCQILMVFWDLKNFFCRKISLIEKYVLSLQKLTSK